MPRNTNRKYRQIVDYVEDQIGADIDRDLLKVAIGAQDSDRLSVETTIRDALKSLDNDELVVRVTDPDGKEVDPSGSNDLVDALKSNDEDELISRLVDSSGSEIDPATVAIEDALKSNDEDELVSRITDSSGSEVDPATVALEEALKSNDEDELISRLAGADGIEVDEEEIGAGIDDDTVAIITYLARALESLSQDSLRSRTTSDSERRFKHDDSTIKSGDTWYIPKGEGWNAGDISLEGTMAVEGSVRTDGDVTGDGKITGDGTVKMVEY